MLRTLIAAFILLQLSVEDFSFSDPIVPIWSPKNTSEESVVVAVVFIIVEFANVIEYWFVVAFAFILVYQFV